MQKLVIKSHIIINKQATILALYLSLYFFSSSSKGAALNPQTYTIYFDSATSLYNAVNGNSGIIDYSSSSPNTTIQNALTALQPNGGSIYLKSATYNITAGLSYTGNDLYFTGDTGAIIKPTVAVSTDVFIINGNDIVIENITIDQSNMLNGNGTTFAVGKVSQTQRFKMSRCYILNPSTSALYLGVFVIGAYIFDNWFQGLSNSPTASGIILDNCSDSFIHNNTIGGFPAGSGILITGAGVNRISENEIYSNLDGIQNYLGYANIINANNFQANNRHGIFIKSDSIGTWTGPIIDSNVIRNSSNNSSGSFDGINILVTSGTVNYCVIKNNSIFDDQALKTQRYGISVAGGASGLLNCVIEGNSVAGNMSGGILLTSISPTVFVKNNPGFNPQGAATITVTASPFTYTNNDGVAETVHITGGTVSVIAKNSITLFTASPATIWLEPGESVTTTYSVAPTMNKDRH